MEKSAFLFAGQGAQYIGMGRDLYEAFPESRAVFDRADKILGFSITKLCFEGPQEELTKTYNCQPAILTVTIAALEAFKKNGGCLLPNISFTAGLSLGEYSALVAAGAVSFEEAVYLVRQRGEFMEEEARKSPGGMLSVIGLDLCKIKEVCLETNTEIANINCPGQTVISGGIKELGIAQSAAKKYGAKIAVMLEVSGAFHSSFMRQASLKLARELTKIKINPAVIPVVSNVTAKPVVSPIEISENLVKQAASPVLWEASMRFILAEGVKKFIEFGPGKVLKGLMRRIEPAAEVINIEKREDVVSYVSVKEQKNAA